MVDTLRELANWLEVSERLDVAKVCRSIGEKRRMVDVNIHYRFCLE